MHCDLFMIDLFSGLGGASAAMHDRGWRVLTVDYNARMNPDVITDVRTWTWSGRRPDLLWASPPCEEFSRHSMPWTRAKNPPLPDLSLAQAAIRIINTTKPRYWVIENVRGAVPFLMPLLGKPAVVGPMRLWGRWPNDLIWPHVTMSKEKFSSQQRAKRAMIPYAVSASLAEAVERARC